MMAVGRHHCHRHILSLQLHAALTVHLFVGGEVVLGEHAAHHVWTLHIAILKVHQHLVANTGTEECTAAWCSHRCDDAHPRRGHSIHIFIYIFHQFLALLFLPFLVFADTFQFCHCSVIPFVSLVFIEIGKFVLLRLKLLLTLFLRRFHICLQFICKLRVLGGLRQCFLLLSI